MTDRPRILCPVCARRPGRLIPDTCTTCNDTGTLTLGPLADTEGADPVAIATAVGLSQLPVDDDDGNYATALELHDAGFVDLEEHAQARTGIRTTEASRTLLGMPVTVDDRVPPGQPWLIPSCSCPDPAREVDALCPLHGHSPERAHPPATVLRFPPRPTAD